MCYNSNEPMENASVLQNFLSVLACGGSVCVSLQLCYKLKIPLTFKKFNGIIKTDDGARRQKSSEWQVCCEGKFNGITKEVSLDSGYSFKNLLLTQGGFET